MSNLVREDDDFKVVRSGVFVSLRGFFNSGNSVRSLEFIVNVGCLVRIVELLSCGVYRTIDRYVGWQSG